MQNNRATFDREITFIALDRYLKKHGTFDRDKWWTFCKSIGVTATELPLKAESMQRVLQQATLPHLKLLTEVATAYSRPIEICGNELASAVGNPACMEVIPYCCAEFRILLAYDANQLNLLQAAAIKGNVELLTWVRNETKNNPTLATLFKPLLTDSAYDLKHKALENHRVDVVKFLHETKSKRVFGESALSQDDIVIHLTHRGPNAGVLEYYAKTTKWTKRTDLWEAVNAAICPTIYRGPEDDQRLLTALEWIIAHEPTPNWFKAPRQLLTKLVDCGTIRSLHYVLSKASPDRALDLKPQPKNWRDPKDRLPLLQVAADNPNVPHDTLVLIARLEREYAIEIPDPDVSEPTKQRMTSARVAATKEFLRQKIETAKQTTHHAP